MAGQVSIPVYGNPRVATQALPGAKIANTAPEAAFGVPAAVDLGGVGKMVSAIAQEGFQHANQVAVSDADAQAVRRKTFRSWDPQSGAMNARGKDAIPAADAAQAGFQSDLDQIEQGLANDQQKEAFRRRRDMHLADLGNQLDQHVGNQVRQYDNDTTNGHLDALTKAAVASYGDERSVQQSVDDTRHLMTDYWRRNGHGEGNGVDDFAQQRIDDRISSMRAAVLGQFANAISRDPSPENNSALVGYFIAHKGDLNADDTEKWQGIADAAKGQHDVTSMADKIIGLNQGTRSKPKEYGVALAEAEAIPDGATRHKVLQQVNAHYADVERAGKLKREGSLERIESALIQSGGKLNTASEDYQNLIGHHELVIAHALQKQIQHPPPNPGDPDAYLSRVILSASSAQGHETFLQETPKDWRAAGMNTQQITHLVQMQNRAAGADDKHDEAKAVQAENIRMQRESALLKAVNVYGGVGAKITTAQKVLLDAETARIRTHFDNLAAARGIEAPTARVSPSSDGKSGNVDLRAPVRMGSSQPLQPVDHSAPLLSALPMRQPTQQQLEEAALHPEFAKALRAMGVAIPKHLPPPVPKK